MQKKLLHIVLPWLVTGIALYFAFRGIEFESIIDHLSNAEPGWVALAALATASSYLMRAYRWRYFFIKQVMKYWEAAAVLILGFFMNNILPARAGELIRAHAGSRISGESRTAVLATIASERLVDGLTVSLMFVAFSSGLGDPNLSHGLLYVSAAFAIAALCVIMVLVFRNKVFSLVERVHRRFNDRASSFVLERVRVFIDGLTPLFMPSRLPAVVFLSAAIWFIELSVYFFIVRAFDTSLSLPLCVLFLAAVNFSSLIPAAPGGIGVIEAVASAVLVSVGVERERALTMALCQHVIQYLVVGIPGLMIMFFWKRRFGSAQTLSDPVQS